MGSFSENITIPPFSLLPHPMEKITHWYAMQGEMVRRHGLASLLRRQAHPRPAALLPCMPQTPQRKLPSGPPPPAPTPHFPVRLANSTPPHLCHSRSLFDPMQQKATPKQPAFFPSPQLRNASFANREGVHFPTYFPFQQ